MGVPSPSPPATKLPPGAVTPLGGDDVPTENDGLAPKISMPSPLPSAIFGRVLEGDVDGPG